MPSNVTWDFSNLHKDRVGERLGLSDEDLEKALPQAQKAHQDLVQRREEGKLPFYDLPNRKETISEILDYSDEARKRFTDVVILGIGGSSLGPAALQMALGRNPDEAQAGPRLHFPDNVDPFEFDWLLGQLDLEKTPLT